MKNKKRKSKKEKIAFSNMLSLIIMAFLFIGLIGGFYLGILSINNQYVGSLLCWTVVFTPIGTATSLCLSKIVDKSKAENTVGGIIYETAMLNNIETINNNSSIDSPEI